MNYELIMLRNALRMKKSAQMLTKEMESLALRSYSTLNWRDGTLGQVNAIANMSRQVDEYLTFYNAVKKALLLTPKGQRALLVAVYLKRADVKLLAQKYNVSRSTVYRKLYYARQAFCRALTAIGCDETWFQANYGDYNLGDE